MSIPTLTHADIKTIAEALGIVKSTANERAKREAWGFEEQAGRGGKKRLYPLATLPSSVRDIVRNYLLMQQIEKEHQDEIITSAGGINTGHKNRATNDNGKRDAGLYVVSADGRDAASSSTNGPSSRKVDSRNLRGTGYAGRCNINGQGIDSDAASDGAGIVATSSGVVGIHEPIPLNDKQKEIHRSIKNIVRFVNGYAGSVDSALASLNADYAAQRLTVALTYAYEHCWDKKRADSQLTRSTYNKWLKRYKKQGNYAPIKIEKDLSIKPWHPLAIALCKSPQGRTKIWIHDQLVTQLGEQAPSSYDVTCAFFRDDFSAIDQLKGRYSGSQLRSHKFYQHRTNAGLAPADEIHADGWNTHFTAPHPKTGEFVTYEVWHFHDVATRYVPQPGIGLTENADVIAKGLENCVRELGVMVHLQTDSTGVVKGNDKFTKALHSMEERLGFTWVHPKEVGNSQANGIPENFNTSWLDKRSRDLATYQNKNSMDSLTFKRVKKLTADMVKAADAGDLIERDKKKREAERMGKGLVFESYQQAVEWIRRIFSEYNDRPHRSLKKIADPLTGKKRHQSPREALQEHIANGWEMTRLDEQELIDAFRPHVVVRVTRETVTPYGGNRYKNSDVLGHWNGKDVVVAYDMDNFDSVVVKDLKGEVICVAEFVGATGYRGQTAREAGDEKRTIATLKRIEKKRETVLKRNPGVLIEHEDVKTIVDFLDLTPKVPAGPMLTVEDFRDVPEEAEKYMSTEEQVMWLYGGGEDPRTKNVAAG